MPKTTIERFPVRNDSDSIKANRVWVFYASNQVAERTVSDDGSLGAAKWVDTEAVIKQLDKIHRPKKAKAEAASFLRYRILAASSGQLVWYVPPTQRTLSFTHSKLKSLSGKMLPMPGCIFSVKGQSLSVFAVSNDTIEPTTELCGMPLPNVYRHSGVCQGSMPRHGTDLSDAEKWTDAFFDSEFTHNTFGNYWRGILKGEPHKLTPLKLNLADCINEH